ALSWDTWRNTWLQLTHAAALSGRVTLLTGSFTPEQLGACPPAGSSARSISLLDCPDDVLASRLRARPAWRGNSAEANIADHQGFAGWLRARITPSFDTGTASAAEVADQLAAWVLPLLPGREAPSQPVRACRTARHSAPENRSAACRGLMYLD